jgi:membrane protease YdiL (CAAX protease family)
MTEKREAWNRVGFYLLVTWALSGIFYYLIIHAGRLGAGRGLFVMGLMWSPGVAGLIARYRYERSLRNHGWTWGKTRYQLWSYLIPIGYATAVYLVVWATGLGGFFNREFLDNQSAAFGWGALPAGLRLILYVGFVGTIGLPSSCASALGEELGWRGFLVPELAKATSFTRVALVSGLVWSFWHYPILLFADYNAGTPAWYALACFTVMVVGISFVFAWMRLKSGSTWTGMLLHASHNLWIQSIFDPLTTDTGPTKYVIGEFGIGLPIAAVILAFLFWRRRGDLPAHGQARAETAAREESARGAGGLLSPAGD